MLAEVRGPLLEEARHSPSLLADLAGLEQYLAESYDSRSFVELLQNADDAGAARFIIQRSENTLLVANDGRWFTRADLESLCRSAASAKTRGASIGYRGIGFKSVVGFAGTIHLLSGDLAATFSRERTATEVPQAERVPLVRIPHPMADADRAKVMRILGAFQNEGLNTVFVFEGLREGVIDNEIAALDATALLFLRNVRHVELRTNFETTSVASITNVQRDAIDARSRSVRLESELGASQWMIIEQGNIAIAFRREDDEIVRLDDHEAVVHAFLPTTEPSGLGARIHGDISTDPSRTRVVFDERTAAGIRDMAKLVVDLIEDSLAKYAVLARQGMAGALIPSTDPRMAGFQRRSFSTELFAAIKDAAVGRFDDLRCRPGWLNADDFELLATAVDLRMIPRHLEGVEGLNGLLRFLGAKDAAITELVPALLTAEPTTAGAAELVTQLAARYATKQIELRDLRAQWHLWPIGGEVHALPEARALNRPLDQAFADLLAERSNLTDARGLLAALSDAVTARSLLPDESEEPAETATEAVEVGDAAPAASEPLPGAPGLKRWHSPEQQIVHVLEARGWSAEEVTRQNVGYQVEARSSAGERTFVAVKAIDYPGQPFALSSHEETVARDKGQRYQVAIVCQAGDNLDVVFVRDPIAKLNWARQCRQWVWECADYEFAPQRFALE